MPVFNDGKGNYFRIPSDKLTEFKMSAEEVQALLDVNEEDKPQTSEKDVVRIKRVPIIAYQWYGGD